MSLFKFNKPDVKKLRASNDIEGLLTALIDNDNKIREGAEDALIGIGTPAIGLLIQSLLLKAKVIIALSKEFSKKLAGPMLRIT
jgi:hypothetical protein